MEPEVNRGLTQEEATDEASRPEKPKEAETRKLDYVMVRHMGYSPETKAHRAIRAGQRKKRFMLENGQRIRSKGSKRMTEVAFDQVLKNLNVLLTGVRNGAIQVCRPDNLEPLTLEQFVDLGARLAKDYEHDLKVDETLLKPLSELTPKGTVWVSTDKEPEAKKELEEDGEKTTSSEPTPPPSEPAPSEPSVEETTPEPSVVETGLLDDQGQEASDEPPAQEEPEKEGESEESDVLTEEDLHKMSRTELNELATRLGVKDPEKLPKKGAVVEQILNVSADQE